MLTHNAEHTAAQALRSTVRVDGFSALTGDRRQNTHTAGMYSGKWHRRGFNVQVVGSAYGRLIMVDDPQPGAKHDAKAWHTSGLVACLTGQLPLDNGPGGFADTAFTGKARIYQPHDHRLKRALSPL